MVSLGHQLRDLYTKHLESEAVKQELERKRLEEPLKDWAKRVIEALPSVLLNEAIKGEYTVMVDLAEGMSEDVKRIKDDVFAQKLPIAAVDAVAEFLKKIKNNFFASGGGKMVIDFCKENDLECKCQNSSDGKAWFNIFWSEPNKSDSEES